MLIELFFKIFAKKLLKYVGMIQLLFQSLNVTMGGAATFATPYVIALSAALAFAQTLCDAMGSYVDEIGVMEKRLSQIK